MAELSQEIRDYMSELGKKGGASRSEAKLYAIKHTRRNNGGRPFGSKNSYKRVSKKEKE